MQNDPNESSLLDDDDPSIRTVEDVREFVEAIRVAANSDDESAHAGEDALHRAVLAAIAAGSAEWPAKMAEVALTTQEISFSRWYA